jgi:hypothetical protein
MPKQTVPALVAGPYRMPRCRAGQILPCVLNGDRKVMGFTDAPIPWPYAFAVKGNRQLFVTGGLERAIQKESVQAVVYHWGVSRWWVGVCRRALGVPRMTEGTTARWLELCELRFAQRRGCYAARKLTREQVKHILRRHSRGEVAARLAREYGVSRQYVSQLVQRDRRSREPGDRR